MKFIEGNICAAKGFTAAGVHCGVRDNKSKLDLAVIFSSVQANAGAVYTQNLVKGAPITVTKNNLANGKAQAIVCNSGNANTCNSNGLEIAEQMCELTGKALNIPKEDVIIGSTGVIGLPMSIKPFETGIPDAASKLSKNADNAIHAIMTTDTKEKECAVAFSIGGVECKLGAIGKGSGMIHPNMATMLVFVTTDCAISSEMINIALKKTIETTFHMVSVDGDTSTNDTVAIMANGLAGNDEITSEGTEFDVFTEALHAVLLNISRKIAKDGEGATRLIECNVENAKDWITAKTAAKGVITSPLVKAMLFGSDANWGRVMCAIGYSGANVDASKIDISFGSKLGKIDVSKGGFGIEFSEDKAKEILSEDEITVYVNLNDGDVSATAFGCDLTYDYVKINGDYRS